MNIHNLFAEFNTKRILIIGDVMIDSYMWGDINRVSPEAPVPVVEIHTYENRLGGAANVALNVKKLGATPILCSVIGGEKSSLFYKLMDQEELATEGIIIDKERKTTIKTRVIANKKHQVRIDEEERSEITNENELLQTITALINNIDVIILQDYNKGVLTPHIIKEVMDIAHRSNIPTIVDPKKENFKLYTRCTIFKPNLCEIKEGIGIDFNEDNLDELKSVTKKLKLLLDANAILLTLSEKGICINSENNFNYIPAFKRNINDISGAGDTVVAVASLCLATRLDDKNTALLSNLAGGIVCEHLGVVPINKEEFISEAIKAVVL